MHSFRTLFLLTLSLEVCRFESFQKLVDQTHQSQVDHHGTNYHSILAADMTQDVCVTAICTGLVTALQSVLIKLTLSNTIDTKLCRKLMHTLSAPCFIILWPYFSSAEWESRLVAVSLPVLQAVRLALSALKRKTENSYKSSNVSSLSEFNLADAVSRSGNRREALGGPTIYVLVVIATTLLFFRDSPVGVVALTQMAVGDGVAEIAGRKWGTEKWSFSPKKSYAGSAAFILGAFVVSCALLYWLSFNGCLAFDVSANVWKLLAISVICAGVELLPVIDDNITVPIAAVVLSTVLF